MLWQSVSIAFFFSREQLHSNQVNQKTLLICMELSNKIHFIIF